MKKMNAILKKCRSLSRLGRSHSYGSLRSKSTRGADELWGGAAAAGEEDHPVVVFVGSSRRPYQLSSKYLHHPVLSALVEKSELGAGDGSGGGAAGISVRCEVVLFDHLLWMLDNANLEPAAEDPMELATSEIFSLVK
ncbi:hypothetical protein Taro_007006 [Colocasia esculenta]|uniref:Uncharacterized protein n=1 Tax=Colocasia esculenta TaxID=4460 RepID=A0A843TTZ8_COLES|nr:hypothetical protein [Colocasia esculenta]